jgi:SprT protein
MSKVEQPMHALAAFLPEDTYTYVVDYLHRYKVHLTVAKARSSVLGDYRNAYKDKHHRISVNGNLNKYAFLITLLHELAHLLTFEQYKHTVASHGKEWKQTYSNLLAVFLQHNIFPNDIKQALMQSLRNPAASSCAEAHLTRALANYDERKPGVFLLEQLPPHTLFATKDGRQFTKGNKLRKRYRCQEVQTGTNYLFSPVYEVMVVNTGTEKD